MLICIHLSIYVTTSKEKEAMNLGTYKARGGAWEG